MWIRGQERLGLINVENVLIVENEKKYCVVSMFNNEKVICLGTYSSKKKALKVVDMIQLQINTLGRIEKDKINCKVYTYLVNDKEIATIDNVFEMPQDKDLD